PQFPVAARAGLGHKRAPIDRITPKLAALQAYQLAIPAPDPPRGTLHDLSVKRGSGLLIKKAGCAACHVPPLFTEPGWNMHKPEEIGIDNFQADRSPDHAYR